jgi:spore coat polysaccharide biosynthesis predicted glycosyltransferase SpsG
VEGLQKNSHRLGAIPGDRGITHVPFLRNREMSRDPVLFRVDATQTTGFENLARCLTYAAALQRRRRPVYFLSRLEPGSLGLNIKRGGNDWLSAGDIAGSADDLEETVQEIRRLKPAAVIVDSPTAGEDYLMSLRRTGAMLVTIDHLANVRSPAHVLINPMLAPDKDAFEFRRDTQILIGHRYAMVRPDIRRCRAPRAQEPAMVQVTTGKTVTEQFRVMVSLGEDDPHRQTLVLAKLLLGAPRVGRVDIVMRSYHPDFEEAKSLAEDQPERLEVASEPPDVAARIVRCHIAVTSGSGWSLELASVGMPQLLIVQSEAHWPTAQRLEEEGCANCLGWHENVSAGTIRTALHNLVNEAQERQSMSRCGRLLIDGRGPDRLVTALEVMLHPAQQLPALDTAA